MEGVFAVYKPKGLTSHQLVERVKKLTKADKVGHAGTLDPLAEGLLIIGVGGKNTKKLHALQKEDKEYLSEVMLGKTSLTGDGEGPISEASSRKPTIEEIKKVLKAFEGIIDQKPHRFSAIKIRGKKSYQIARKGQEPDLKPRKVLVKKIDLLSYDYPILSIRVVTGPGVYIRSLAEDIGSKLKTGAYLKSLKRTRVGKFKESDLTSLEDFKKQK